MTDLVKRLRDPFYTPSLKSHTEAAERIEKLVDELHHCFHRINELQAALREIAYTEPEDKYWPGRIARKALEGKE